MQSRSGPLSSPGKPRDLCALLDPRKRRLKRVWCPESVRQLSPCGVLCEDAPTRQEADQG